MLRMKLVGVALAVLGALGSAHAQVKYFGDQDVLGSGWTYASDPTAGAALMGLAPGAVTYSTLTLGHGYPFAPAPGDFAGTDQIYTGSGQTGNWDGYSSYAGLIRGPQVLTLDYASLVQPGRSITSVTLGIAADDFQQPAFGQPFIASVNGTVHAGLTSVLNAINQGGPTVQFFSIGLDPNALSPTHTLSVSIDQAGDGGDGWAVDFLTVGVTVAPVPEPSEALMMVVGGLAVIGIARRRLRRA